MVAKGFSFWLAAQCKAARSADDTGPCKLGSMTRPRPWRSKLSGWLALLLVAAAINIIIAWACALWSPVRNTGVEITASVDAKGNTSGFAEAACRAWRLPGDGFVTESDWYVSRRISATLLNGFGARHTRVALSSRDVSYGVPPYREVGHMLVIESVWPLPTFIADHSQVHPDVFAPNGLSWSDDLAAYRGPDRAANWRGAFQIPLWVGSLPVTPHSGATWFPLPYHIRPLNFVLNTLFYALVIVLPGFTFRRTRTHLRRRRGLCTRCAYTLKDLPICPECGTPRDRHMPAAPEPVHSAPQ